MAKIVRLTSLLFSLSRNRNIARCYYFNFNQKLLTKKREFRIVFDRRCTHFAWFKSVHDGSKLLCTTKYTKPNHCFVEVRNR